MHLISPNSTTRRLLNGTPSGRSKYQFVEVNSSAHHCSLLFQSIAMIRAGALVPISPLEVFDVSRVAEAFTYFGSAARMGKIVISFEDPKSSIPVLEEQIYFPHDS